MARKHLEKLSGKPPVNSKSGSCCLLPGKEASYFIPSLSGLLCYWMFFQVQYDKKSLGIRVEGMWLWSYQLCTQPV